MIVKNKKTDKKIIIKFHSQHDFDEEGIIVKEYLYYNANLLK